MFLIHYSYNKINIDFAMQGHLKTSKIFRILQILKL